jgi:hypothetical protein
MRCHEQRGEWRDTSVASYEEWNSAIIEHFTRESPKSTGIFMTANDESIEYVGTRYLQLEGEHVLNDFVTAVQHRCTETVGGTRQLCLDMVKGTNKLDSPKGVAFLAAMVLAAHRMSGRDDVDPSNYFARLAELLGVEPGTQSRPRGMSTGEEEGLWLGWNDWLAQNGWEPTARRGPEGATKYLHYTIEQALLRDDDVEFLKTQFARMLLGQPEGHSMDEAQLGSWLRRQRFTRRHLRAGFDSAEPGRAGAFYDAAYRVYETMDWASGEGKSMPERARRLIGGIKRRVSLKGRVSYLLFPRKPTQWKPVDLTLEAPDGSGIPLEVCRGAYFETNWEVDPFVTESTKFRVTGSPDLDELVFPARDFWILTPDPEDSRGSLATWEKYPSLLGKRFTILMKGSVSGELCQELERYMDEGLINWEAAPYEDDRGWVEYRGCMVLSRAWEGIVPSQNATGLYDTLKPAVFATAALAGGLRSPNQNAWLEGFPPSLRIYGFEKNFEVRIFVNGAKFVATVPAESQQTVELPQCKSPGLYRLEVVWGGKAVAGRGFRVIDWKFLEPSPDNAEQALVLGSAKVRGPIVELPGQRDG